MRLPRFPFLVWVMLGGMFLTRTAFFMVWPFLAIILDREFGLAPSRIGAILAASLFAGAILGFYSGNLSDRFGRGNLMITGCAGNILAYMALAVGSRVAFYVIGAFLAGICRAVLESPGRALIADAIEDQATRELAYHTRYFLMNVGAAVGPFLGIVFGLTARQVTFWVTSAAYGVFAAILVVAFRFVPERRRYDPKESSLKRAVRVLGRDHRFLMLLGANFLMLVAYSQQEATLVQYLNLEGGEVVLGLFTALIATNAMTIVVFQFPLLRVLGRWDLYTRSYLGLALFVAGFVTYAFLPVGTYAGWMTATWVLSMGEAILFPTLNLQIDRMAPEHLKGSYFGASALGGLGFAIGPLMGGFALQYLGGRVTFLLVAGVTACSGVCYRRSRRLGDGIAVPPVYPEDIARD